MPRHPPAPVASRESESALTRSAAVVCGVDASRADENVVRQACEMAGPGGSVGFICVVESSGSGLNAQATIGHTRAEGALEHAQEIARDCGVTESFSRLEHDRSPGARLAALVEALDPDLVVVGTHGRGRAGAFMLGSAGSYLLQHVPAALLVARGPSTSCLRDSVLVASDGSTHAGPACDLAATVAGASSRLAMVSVGQPRDQRRRHRLAEQSVALGEAGATRTDLLVRVGNPAEEILAAVGEVDGTLLVVGRSGRHGIRRLGSVSEHVVHSAPCSVLVARATPPEPA